MENSSVKKWSFHLIDLLIFIFSYFLVHFYRYHTLELLPRNRILLYILIIVWIGTSLYYNKHQKIRTYSLWRAEFFNGYVALATLFVSSFFLVLIAKYNVSRKLLFSTFAVYTLLSSLLVLLYYKFSWSNSEDTNTEDKKEKFRNISFDLNLFILDLVGIPSSFYLLNYFKRKKFELTPEYESIFWVLFGVWIFSSLVTKKYISKKYRNIYYAVGAQIRTLVVAFVILAVIIITFHLFMYSRMHLFGTLFITSIPGISLATYRLISSKVNGGDIETIARVKEILKREKYDLPEMEPVEDPALKVVDALRQFHYNDLAEFVEKYIPLNVIHADKAHILNSRNIFNIQILEPNKYQLILNAHKLNDIRYLNKYFLEVHQKLEPGGFLVGYVHTLKTHYTWMREKFPRILFFLVYPLDFIWKRIMPKLPGFKKVYFFVTRGYNRLISEAEVLGRMAFCGFKIIRTEEINNRLYFLVQKSQPPAEDENPSYSPIIRLKRIGLNGEIIYLRKFRTMYPYSEYLQEYVYENFQLDETGKFKNDFRVTEYGKWFRKFWIDELPQLINWLEGDVSLVGVRALSQHYFSLYPEDVQKLRIQFKPGLVPPYYADMPKTFEEIVESERRYLLQKQKSPILTDIKYFFKAMYNIFFRNARSK